jgi:serine/threonine protein phosphatase 1
MADRTIAIGDIHGCRSALAALIDAIAPEPSDCLVTLGDYVDRGPDSRGVIELLMELRQQCQLVPLLGNHELMFLRALADESERPFWLNFGGRQTLASYGSDFDAIPAEHMEFLGNCLPYFETESHIFIHANYDPELPLDQHSESIAMWTHLTAAPPAPHVSGKIVVVGHTPQIDGEIRDWGHVLCIDTCCFGGGWLTAIDVVRKDTWQANRLGILRKR